MKLLYKKLSKKKNLVIIAIFLIISYLVYTEITYSPLNKDELNSIFYSYENVKKKRSKDFIKLDLHGDRDEIYEYKVKKGVLNTNFPISLKKWNEELIDDKSIVSGWKKCPLDSSTISMFFLHRLKEGYGYRSHFLESNLLVDFRKAQDNGDNLYCYIITEESYYFFIYCPKKNILYYHIFNI